MLSEQGSGLQGLIVQPHAVLVRGQEPFPCELEDLKQPGDNGAHRPGPWHEGGGFAFLTGAFPLTPKQQCLLATQLQERVGHHACGLAQLPPLAAGSMLGLSTRLASFHGWKAWISMLSA